MENREGFLCFLPLSSPSSSSGSREREKKKLTFFRKKKTKSQKQDLLRHGPLRLRLCLERLGFFLRGRRRRQLGGVLFGRQAAPLGRAEG